MVPTQPRPIWSKRAPVRGAAAKAAARAVAYCAGRDVAGRPPADAALIPYDLWTNRAHCRMLARRGIIGPREEAAIARALTRLERAWRNGRFTLDPALEDVHINVERWVAREAGEAVAGVMHTARSRNDQAATDMRLWLRDRLLDRTAAAAALVARLADLAARHPRTVAPGWTHGQPAMPTTLGHWAAAHGWALARDLYALRALWPLVNRCPLGAAASFGTSWPIDRTLTARLLGFDAPEPNALDAVSWRGEAEARVGCALAMMMSHLASLAQDLIFLSAPPRSLVRLPDSHVTGSSIMPQKRNPDFCEVTRARALAVHGLASNLLGVGRGALSGYNRDLQWTKYWIMDLMDEVGEAPEVFAEALAGLTVDEAALARAAREGFAGAADLADRLARTRRPAGARRPGVPFRRVYHLVAEAASTDEAAGWFRLETLNALLARERIEPPLTAQELDEAGDPRRLVAARRSLGGPAPDDVQRQARALRRVAADVARWVRTRRQRLEAARRLCA